MFTGVAKVQGSNPCKPENPQAFFSTAAQVTYLTVKVFSEFIIPHDKKKNSRCRASYTSSLERNHQSNAVCDRFGWTYRTCSTESNVSESNLLFVRLCVVVGG